MAEALDEARAAVAELESADDDELYRLLGMRVKAIERDPSKAGSYAPDVRQEEMGIAFVAVIDIGKRTFGRLAAAGHSLICGSPGDQGFHLQRLLSTLNTDATTVTAAVATLLVGQLAIAPAVAGIVATIVVGKAAPASLESLCKTWASKIPAPEGVAADPGAGGGEPQPQPEPQPPVMPPSEPPTA